LPSLKYLAVQRVKHQHLKCCIALPLLDENAVNSTIKKLYKYLRNPITLLTYLLPCTAACVPATSSRSWGTVEHLARPATECSW